MALLLRLKLAFDYDVTSKGTATSGRCTYEPVWGRWRCGMRDALGQFESLDASGGKNTGTTMTLTLPARACWVDHKDLQASWT
jgi:hypothetical protein